MAPSFLSITYHGEAFHSLGVQDVESLILVGALLLLDGGRRREGKEKEKKKKNCQGEGGFPGGWTCLADSAAGHSF
jgi:hypothetical protein